MLLYSTQAPATNGAGRLRGVVVVMALQRTSPIPLYYQLATRLRDELAGAAWPVGARYHSDRGLVRAYGVSLLTVRQAVNELVRAGLVARRQGSGTFVTGRATRAVVARPPPPARARAVLFCGWTLAALSGTEMMYFRDLYEGISEEVAARGWRLVLEEQSPAPGAELVAEARARGVCGVVAVVGKHTRAHVRLLTAAGIPVVTVNLRLPGVPAVMPDDAAGGRLAVEHLLALGHRRLVQLNSGEMEIHWRAVRHAYLDALAEAGLAPAANPVYDSRLGRGSVEAGYELTRDLWRAGQRPTGIVAGNDLMAIGALQYLREAGVAVPGAVSVVGFDDLEAARICAPPLTTVAVDRLALGRAAVRRLLALPRRRGTGPLVTCQPVHLVERASTGPAPTNGRPRPAARPPRTPTRRSQA